VKITSLILYRFMRPHACVSSFLIFSSSVSSPSHPQGAIDKVVLPEGMQSVTFAGCWGLTGTAELEGWDGHIYLIRFGGQPHTLPHSSLYSFSSLRLHFCRCSQQGRAPRRNAERDVRGLPGPHRYGWTVRVVNVPITLLLNRF
jgi:hypothetical protein